MHTALEAEREHTGLGSWGMFKFYFALGDMTYKLTREPRAFTVLGSLALGFWVTQRFQSLEYLEDLRGVRRVTTH